MARLNIRPLGDKVIIKRLDAEEKTTGGIVLPESMEVGSRLSLSEPPDGS